VRITTQQLDSVSSLLNTMNYETQSINDIENVLVSKFVNILQILLIWKLNRKLWNANGKNTHSYLQMLRFLYIKIVFVHNTKFYLKNVSSEVEVELTIEEVAAASPQQQL